MFSEIFKMKEENSSISSLKEEFAQRIADAEKKVQLACKERDTAKKVIVYEWDLLISDPYYKSYFGSHHKWCEITIRLEKCDVW